MIKGQIVPVEETESQVLDEELNIQFKTTDPRLAIRC
jgi:hypothetical protein